MRHKTLSGIEIKDAAQGTVRAVFSTLDVIDADGDVTTPGAFADGASVRISAYGHSSWGDKLPVGKGTIHEEGNEAILDGQFFLSTQAGRETFEVIKGLAELGEWSYGFDVVESDEGTQDGQEVTFLRKLAVYEVSPVLLGAGVNTRTLAVKGRGAKQLDSDLHQEFDEAATERFGGPDTYVYCRDFDVDEGYAIFSICSRTDYSEDRLVQVPFLRGADGDVTLGSEVVEVEQVISYEPDDDADEALEATGSGGDAYAALRQRAAALSEVKASELPDPKEGEELAAYDERVAKAARAIAEDGPNAPPAGRKLSDHLASVTAEVEAVTERLAEVATARGEKGKELGEASREAAEALEARLKALREVLASAAENDEPSAEDWGEGLEIEDQLLRAQL